MSTSLAILIEFLILFSAMFYCSANGNSPGRVLPVVALAAGQAYWGAIGRTDLGLVFSGVVALFALTMGAFLVWAHYSGREGSQAPRAAD